jgi:hypothetical protein
MEALTDGRGTERSAGRSFRVVIFLTPKEFPDRAERQRKYDDDS